jgi:DNA primase
VIRRLLQDHDEFRGEVIFTFDGDEAGQKAALRAFEGDQNFAGQTYVAVEPTGLDPCDLRLSTEDRAEGEAAVRELVARRIPLYRFVLANVVNRYDLDRADGRIDALREAARLVTSIRDRSKVDAFARELAGMLGIEPVDVQREVRKASAQGGSATTHSTRPAPDADLPHPRDPRLYLERETLKLVVQHPGVVGRTARDVGPDDFTHGAYRAVWKGITEAGGPAGPAAGDPQWAAALRDAQPDERLKSLLSALAVEPLHSAKQPDDAYVAQHVHRLRELTALRRIADLKSRLQRTNPVEQATDYNRMFGELVALEQHRRSLRERALESQ